MKICPQCKIEMKQLGNENMLVKGYILISKGDGFGIRDRYGNLTSYYHVCPGCGLIQQYVPDGLLEHIKKL